MRKMEIRNDFRKFCCIISALALLILVPLAQGRAAEKEKVILDTDMVELLDDGVAMMMLAQAPNIQLEGVTIVFGNTWVETGTAAAIRQLEGMGRKDIPVFMGVNEPTRKGRFDHMAEEKRLYGQNFDSHRGAAGYPRPASWQQAYRERYHREPELQPQKEAAADFIVRTIRENPGEVTLVAIGSGANLAAALDRDPAIAGLVKQVVYMAGAFMVEGNVMPHAEFNVWIDPESARKVYRAPWKKKIFLPLDVCNTAKLSQREYQKLTEKITQPWAKAMWKDYWAGPLFRQDPGFSSYIWDVLAAAVVIDPQIITWEETLPVDVNDQYGPGYGDTLAYRGFGPEGTQKARIVFAVDQDRLWPMVEGVFDRL
jgi:inosine-uridine nucleoside N-ribohydrolase